MQRGAAKALEGRAIAGDSPVAVGHAAFLVTVREYRGTRETRAGSWGDHFPRLNTRSDR